MGGWGVAEWGQTWGGGRGWGGAGAEGWEGGAGAGARAACRAPVPSPSNPTGGEPFCVVVVRSASGRVGGCLCRRPALPRVDLSAGGHPGTRGAGGGGGSQA